MRGVLAMLLVACGGSTAGSEGLAGSSDATSSAAVTSSGSTSEPDASTGSSTSGADTSTGAPGSTSGTDTSTGGLPTAMLPAEVLDLSNWKLTLPIPDPADATSPLEILQPELATYTIDPWFQLDDTGARVAFRANAGGTTTSNSGYPRSELREMIADGSDLAAWSTTDGEHVMTIVQAITALPPVKPHVVAGQIHDSNDDVVMIRLEDTHLFVEGGGDELGELDPAYVLGTEFTVRVRATAGVIEVYYEDLAAPAVTIERAADGCYFKAGAYVQSNVDHGDAADAYGEVVIRDLQITHA